MVDNAVKAAVEIMEKLGFGWLEGDRDEAISIIRGAIEAENKHLNSVLDETVLMLGIAGLGETADSITKARANPLKDEEG